MAGTQGAPIDLTTELHHSNESNDIEYDETALTELVYRYLDDKLGKPIYFQRSPPEWLERYIERTLA